MTPAEVRPLTPAQRRALEAVRDGRVVWSSRSMRYVGARRSTVDALLWRRLVEHGPWLDSWRCRVVLTDAGWEALGS